MPHLLEHLAAARGPAAVLHGPAALEARDAAQTRGLWVRLGTPRAVLQNGHGLLGSKKVEVLYELLGVADGGYMFFLSPLQNNYYELLVLGKNGTLVRRSRITLNDKKIAFRTFYLDPSGVLTALLAHNYGASVVWWRSDKLIEGLSP